MARRSSKSSLVGSMKGHAKDETEFGQQIVNVPPGIRGGVALLKEAVVDKYKKGANKGKRYVRLMGIICEPVSHTYIPTIFKNGEVQNLDPVTTKTKGLRTQLMLALCKTNTKEEDENVANALNEIRKVGGEDCLDFDDCKTEEDVIKELESTLESIVEDGVYFSFGTSASEPNEDYPEPRVWENWYGTRDTEDYQPEDSDDDSVEDNTEDSGSDGGSDGDKDDDPPFGESDELEELADKAEKDDEDAQNELDERAKKVNVDTSDEEKTWHQIANEIRDAEEGGSDGGSDGGEDEPPQKGEEWMYKFPRTRKAVAVEIKSSNKSKKTCSVAAVDGDKTAKDVPWDKLEEITE